MFARTRVIVILTFVLFCSSFHSCWIYEVTAGLQSGRRWLCNPVWEFYIKLQADGTLIRLHKKPFHVSSYWISALFRVPCTYIVKVMPACFGRYAYGKNTRALCDPSSGKPWRSDHSYMQETFTELVKMSSGKIFQRKIRKNLTASTKRNNFH
jgi:hypothetical protein